MGVAGKEEREIGDKLIFPASSFRDVARLKLALPLFFTVENEKKPNVPTAAASASDSKSKKSVTSPNSKSNASPKRSAAAAAAAKSNSPPAAAASPTSTAAVQYCGVLEFSAPDDTIYAPHWMMENLRVTEGGRVRVKNIAPGTLSKGKEAVFQPYEQAFVDLLKEQGPKFFLESTLRHFSALRKGQRIVIPYKNRRFSVNVVETKPTNSISILGNVDLKVDFVRALDAPLSPQSARGGAAGGPKRIAFDMSAGANTTETGDEEDQLSRALAMSLTFTHTDAKEGQTVSANAAPSAAAAPVGDDEGWAVIDTPAAAASSSAAVASQPVDEKKDVFGQLTRQSSGDSKSGGYSMLSAQPQRSAAAASDPPAASPAAVSNVASPQSAASSVDDYDSSKEDDDAAGGGDGADTPAWRATLEGASDPAKTFCENCRRFVPAANIRMHTLHCARQLVRCTARLRSPVDGTETGQVCGRVIPKTAAPSAGAPAAGGNGVAQHASVHELVACPNGCGVQTERRWIRKHTRTGPKATCTMRPAACKFCSKPTPFATLPSHEVECGSRADSCARCGAQFTVRRRAEHTPAVCAPKCSLGCGQSISLAKIDSHLKFQCENRIMKCSFCQLPFKVKEKAAHETYCGSRTEVCELCNRSIKLRDMDVHRDSACQLPAPVVAPPPAAAARRPVASAVPRVASQPIRQPRRGAAAAAAAAADVDDLDADMDHDPALAMTRAARRAGAINSESSLDAFTLARLLAMEDGAAVMNAAGGIGASNLRNPLAGVDSGAGGGGGAGINPLYDSMDETDPALLIAMAESKASHSAHQAKQQNSAAASAARPSAASSDRRAAPSSDIKSIAAANAKQIVSASKRDAERDERQWDSLARSASLLESASSRTSQDAIRNRIGAAASAARPVPPRSDVIDLSSEEGQPPRSSAGGRSAAVPVAAASPHAGRARPSSRGLASPSGRRKPAEVIDLSQYDASPPASASASGPASVHNRPSAITAAANALAARSAAAGPPLGSEAELADRLSRVDQIIAQNRAQRDRILREEEHVQATIRRLTARGAYDDGFGAGGDDFDYAAAVAAADRKAPPASASASADRFVSDGENGVGAGERQFVGLNDPTKAFLCPQCTSVFCSDYEAVQVHMLTDCSQNPHSAQATAAAAAASAPRRPPSAKAKAKPATVPPPAASDPVAAARADASRSIAAITSVNSQPSGSAAAARPPSRSSVAAAAVRAPAPSVIAANPILSAEAPSARRRTAPRTGQYDADAGLSLQSSSAATVALPRSGAAPPPAPAASIRSSPSREGGRRSSQNGAAAAAAPPNSALSDFMSRYSHLPPGAEFMNPAAPARERKSSAAPAASAAAPPSSSIASIAGFGGSGVSRPAVASHAAARPRSRGAAVNSVAAVAPAPAPVPKARVSPAKPKRVSLGGGASAAVAGAGAAGLGLNSISGVRLAAGRSGAVSGAKK